MGQVCFHSRENWILKHKWMLLHMPYHFPAMQIRIQHGAHLPLVIWGWRSFKMATHVHIEMVFLLWSTGDLRTVFVKLSFGGIRKSLEIWSHWMLASWPFTHAVSSSDLATRCIQQFGLTKGALPTETSLSVDSALEKQLCLQEATFPHTPDGTGHKLKICKPTRSI